MNFFKYKANLDRLVSLISSYFMNPDETNQGKLYLEAVLSIGKDASPIDLAGDSNGCAESVTNVLRKILPEVPVILGTYTLLEHLKQSPRFQQTVFLRPGTIVICATGTGNGRIQGHVGIVGKQAIIMSSDSATGLWLENFTYGSWYHKYHNVGGFKVYLFAVI